MKISPDGHEDFRVWTMFNHWGIDRSEIPFIVKALNDGMVVIVREQKGQKWLNGRPNTALVAASRPDNSCAEAMKALMEL